MPFPSGWHLFLILGLLVVVLIIWGPGKLPDVGAGLGRAIREFRKASSDARDQLMSSASEGGSAAATTASAPAQPTAANGAAGARGETSPEHPASS